MPIRKKHRTTTYKFLLSYALSLLILMHCNFLDPTIGIASQGEKSPIKKAIKQKGWNLPWLMHDINFGRSSKKIKIQNKNITETQLIPTHDLFTELDTYTTEKQILIATTYLCYVKKLSAYGNENGTFGYGAILEPVELQADGAIKQSFGFVLIVYYYDDDNDGIFETLEFGAEEPRLPFNTK